MMKHMYGLLCIVAISLNMHAATVAWDQMMVINHGSSIVLAQGPRFNYETGGLEWGDSPRDFYGSVGLNTSGVSYSSTTITTSSYFWFESYTSLWIVSTYGDVIMDSTIGHLADDLYLQKNPMEPLPESVSGALSVYPTKSVSVDCDENNRFYLAYAVQSAVDSTWCYGWVQLEVNGSSLSMVHSAIDVDGDPIRVGYMPTSIPEPSGGVLFLLGVAALGLRRRRLQRGGA